MGPFSGGKQRASQGGGRDGRRLQTRDAASTDGWSGSTEEVEDAEKSEDQEKTTSGSISSLDQQPEERQDGDSYHSTDDSHYSQKEEQTPPPTATGRGDFPKRTGRGEAEKKAQGPEAKKTSGTRRRAPGQQLAERRTKTPTKLRQEVHLKTIRLNKMY